MKRHSALEQLSRDHHHALVVAQRLRRADDAEHPLIAKVLTDHVRIRHLAGELAKSEPPAPRLMHELGTLLEAHVRREERQLFPMIEESLPDEALGRLVDLLAR